MNIEKTTLVWYGDERFSEIIARLEKNMPKACSVVEKEARENFSVPGTGRLYGKHRASAPGKPPAVDTDRLRSSITHEVEKIGDDIIGRVGTNVIYSKWLEHGTSKMANRPWLFPAFERSKLRIKDLLDD
jgi:phage gpG-like protein